MPQFTNLDAIKKRRDELAAKQEKKERKRREKELKKQRHGEELVEAEEEPASKDKDEEEEEDKPTDSKKEKKKKKKKEKEMREHARKHLTIQEQLDDLEDLTEPIPEDDPIREDGEKKGKRKSKKDDKTQAGTIGMQITRQRTSTNLLAANKDKTDKTGENKKSKKKDKKKQIGAVKLAEESTSSQIKLTDRQCDKLMELAGLINEVKVAADGQSGKIDDCEAILEQVEDSVANLQKVCSTCQFIWRIDEFNDKFEAAVDGTNKTLYSPAFRSHPYGYQLALSLCPNGDGRGKGQFMSIFFCLLKGDQDSLLEWPFSCHISFTLLDQAETHEVNDIAAEFIPYPAKENLPFLGRPTKARNPSLGLPRFAAHSDLKAGQYVKDSSIFIRVEVDLGGLAIM